MATTRRTLLRVAALLGGAALITTRPWSRSDPAAFRFEPIADLPPLRRLATQGALASGGGPDRALIGLTVPGAPRPPDAPLVTRSEICRLLHLPWPSDGPLPVTYFTDIRCPVCRTLERDLAAIQSDAPALFVLHTREFPVFGPRSEAAARVIRAAAAQGAAQVVRAHLQTRPAPEVAPGVSALATTLGIDPQALVQAWQSPVVADLLAEDRALAHRLGLRGTPGLVIGRTVVPGALPRATLKLLMENERDAPQALCAPV